MGVIYVHLGPDARGFAYAAATLKPPSNTAPESDDLTITVGAVTKRAFFHLDLNSSIKYRKGSPIRSLSVNDGKFQLGESSMDGTFDDAICELLRDWKYAMEFYAAIKVAKTNIKNNSFGELLNVAPVDVVRGTVPLPVLQGVTELPDALAKIESTVVAMGAGAILG